MRRPIVVLTVLFTLIAPLWGAWKSSNQKEYEVVSIDSQKHVILADYHDSVVFERCS